MKEIIVEREIFKSLKDHLNEQEISIITGSRQVGKTCLMTMLKNYLIDNLKKDPKNILYYNLDLVRDREFFQNQDVFIEYLDSLPKERKHYIFIDEAQKVPDCARFFKGVYDSSFNIKLILSGSSSFELKTKLKESLAGRKKIFTLSSFSFYEYLAAKSPAAADILKMHAKIPVLERKILVKHYFDYLVWGGYPRVTLKKEFGKKMDVLADIYSSYIERDIIGFWEIKNWMAFSKLLKLLAGQIGNLSNISELSNSIDLDRDTIERYIKILSETFIIKSLLPYYKNPRQEIIKQNKIYFSDLGIRNYALESYSSAPIRPDSGILLENASFNEISQRLTLFKKIRFWRTKQGAEVDFLVLDTENILLPIEIKLNLKKPAITLGFRNFLEKYSPKKAIIVSLGIFDKSIKIGSTSIMFIHPYEIRRYLN